MFKRFRVTMVGLLLLLLAFAPCGATELVINPGFETGDFTGWVQLPASSGSDFGVDGLAHSGTYAAFFAASDVFDDSISQTLATVAGQSYSITFWLAQPTQPAPSPTPNDFSVYWDGNPLLSLVDAGYFDYVPYTFTMLASTSSTILRFNGLDAPASFRLDDVSVTEAQAVPEPAGMLLLGISLVGLTMMRRESSK